MIKYCVLTMAIFCLSATATIYNLDGVQVDSARPIIRLNGSYVYSDTGEPVVNSLPTAPPLALVLPAFGKEVPTPDNVCVD